MFAEDGGCSAGPDRNQALLELEKMKEQGMSWLLEALDKGRVSGEQEGWLTAEDVLHTLEARYHG